jgi:hypothetical protein
VDAPELTVPPQHGGGVFANHVRVYVDLEYVTLDFARLDPRELGHGMVVARVSLPTSA